MEFKQLRSFVAVVRYGSFTKAAEKLFISQPTISLHIRALEEDLGCRLILRTTKSVEVTAKGREVYDYAVHILELEERMIRCCAADQRRIIHLGASTIPSAYILPSLLPEFGALNPDTYFTIHQENSQGIIDGLNNCVFDVGLIGMKDEEKLCCVPFLQDRMVLITPVTEEFLAMQRLPQPPLEELFSHPVILREKGSGSQKSADRFLEAMGIAEERLNITARINDQETIKNFVAGGLGVSIISEQAAQNFVREKRLLQFALPMHDSRKLYIAWRKEGELPRHVKEFVDFVLKKYPVE